MKINLHIKFIILLAFFFNLSVLNSSSYSDDRVCGNDLINHIIKFGDRNFEYNELRNDAGIHFAYDWDKLKRKIIIKRNKDNYPIVRYSLFENKNFFPNKTIVKKIDNLDLSKLEDKRIIKLTYLSGNTNWELNNNKIITITSKPYKFNDFKLSRLVIST